MVEIVDREGNLLPNGQAGEIVITHLATRDFPFIRYRTGDVAILDDKLCSCRLGLPLLREIQGRTTDFVVAADGTLMHGLSLIYSVRDVPGVRQFRIEQESQTYTRVLLVLDPGVPPERLEAIRVGMVRRLGEGVTVMIECVDAIPVEASGKFRYVVSKVAPRC